MMGKEMLNETATGRSAVKTLPLVLGVMTLFVGFYSSSALAAYLPTSIVDYGASISNPDNSAAINAALSHGGNVYVPPGVYKISQVLIIPSHTTLYGVSGSIIKLNNNSVSGLNHGAMIYAEYSTDIRITGLEIDGNKANNDTDTTVGNVFQCYGCTRVTIDHNYIHDGPRDGVSFGDVLFSPNTGDYYITDNQISGMGAASQLTGGEGIFIGHGNRITISNNHLTGNLLRGVEIEPGFPAGTFNINWSIIGNIGENNQWGCIGDNGSSYGSIVGNICNNNPRGINISVSGPPPAFVTVSDNIINNSSIAGIVYDNIDYLTSTGNVSSGSTVGMQIQDVFGLTSNGDIVTNSIGNGIDFKSGTNTNLSFNGCLVSNSNTGNDGTSSNIAGNATSVTITGCRLSAGSHAVYGIDMSGVAWMVEGNSLDTAGITSPIHNLATGGKVRNNLGYTTESNGSSTITSGNTSVVVTHGLNVTPSAKNISITPTNSTTNSIGSFWISNITSTQFTVNVTNNPGTSGFSFGWQVIVL